MVDESPAHASGSEHVADSGQPAAQSAGQATSVPLIEQLESLEDGTRTPLIAKQPVREEMVRQAVSFLSHPKVKGSPIKFRRAFLEKKGLTADEIDKAFQEVPDVTTGNADVSAASASHSYVPSTAKPFIGNVQLSAEAPTAATGHPSQVAHGTLIASPPASPGVHQASSGLGMVRELVHPQVPSVGQVHMQGQKHGRVSWVHLLGALATVGVATVGSAYMARKYAFPRIKAWILEQAKAEDRMREQLGKAQGQTSEEPSDSEKISALAAEMKALASELRGRPPSISSTDIRKEVLSCLSVMSEFNGGVTGGAPAVVSKQRKSAEEERAERLEREIEELKKALRSSAVAQFTAPSLISAADPPMHHLNPSSLVPSTGSLGAETLPMGFQESRTDASYEAPMSKSYVEIMEMVKRGKTPPGIRDIDDKPPNPNAVPTASSIALKPKKPWEQQPWGTATAWQGSMQRQALGHVRNLERGQTQTGMTANGTTPWLHPASVPVPDSSPVHAASEQYLGHPAENHVGETGRSGSSNTSLKSTAARELHAGEGVASAAGPDVLSQESPTGGLPVEKNSNSTQDFGYAAIERRTPMVSQASPLTSWVPPSIPKPAMAEAEAAMRRFPAPSLMPWVPQEALKRGTNEDGQRTGEQAGVELKAQSTFRDVSEACSKSEKDDGVAASVPGGRDAAGGVAHQETTMS